MASLRDADGEPESAVDPKLRATTQMILAMPIDDRLRQIEAESNFFSSIRPIDG